MSKRSADEPIDENDMFQFVALGGGSEVGRSCHIISYKGKTVMLDAGVHPAYSGLASLPFYDEYDLSTVDILLISHFHLDHAASLPYVMQHTNFKGRVFMTHPTKAIFRWLLGDFMRVSNVPENYQPLYTQEDLEASFDRIETIDYHSTMEIEGIKFTAYHAGHVLGAAMYFVEIAGVKVLFTGDYSREEDRHLNQAEIPAQKPDILITESTYGTGIHQPRLEKEARLMKLIQSTVQKGGRCLLPVFALGRAQEILLILDEYWEAHGELQDINIYYVSSLAKKCMAVYQTYINMMNENIRKKFRDSRTNPFQFKHIKSVRNLERFDDIGPCVMVATPGMLQSGVSRELLERWAPDSKNSLLVTGYSVEGTMAKQMLTEPPEIASLNNPEVKIPRRMAVEELSFAAHVDYKENARFIDIINAPHIILVHGEQNNMGRLKSALLSKYSDRKGTEREVKIYNPKNCYEVELPFKSLKIARTMGDLAGEPPYDGQIISGVLVEKDFHLNLLHVSDLREYASLTTSVVIERQSVIVDAGPELIRYHLEQMFGVVEVLGEEEKEKENGNGNGNGIKKEADEDEEVDGVIERKNEDEDNKSTEFLIMSAVKVIHKGNVSTIEWVGNVMNDAIADSILAVLLSVDVSPASVKLSSCSCQHTHEHDHSSTTTTDSRTKIDQISALLKAQFGDCLKLSPDYKTATIEIEGVVAHVEFKNLSVQCTSPALERRVAAVLERAVNTAAPLAQNTSRLIEIKEEDQPSEISVKSE